MNSRGGEVSQITIFPIGGIPIISEGDDISEILIRNLLNNPLKEGDIIVCCHTIISKAEGQVSVLNDIKPSDFAENVAKVQNKDPRFVEVVLRHSKRIVRMTESSLICETHHGFICANAGCDQSNTELGTVVSLPISPSRTAKRIRHKLQCAFNLSDVAVIVSDSFGRPHRHGAINVAIGVSGLEPVYHGELIDLYDRKLEKTTISLADQIASAAGLVMGESNEGFPCIVVRGVKYSKESKNKIPLSRAYQNEIFR